MHRRRLALTYLAPVRTEDPASDILRLANDARIRHAVKRLRHFLGDCVECAAKHAQGHAIDRGLVREDLGVRLHHVSACMITRLPQRSTWAENPGGIRVVVSIWSTIAGPSIRLPALRPGRQ